jgi:hypothetical protein
METGMKRKCVSIATVLVLAALLFSSSGCAEVLWAANVVSLATGWLTRGLVPPMAEFTCYRNGVLVNCADVPAELLPAQ